MPAAPDPETGSRSPRVMPDGNDPAPSSARPRRRGCSCLLTTGLGCVAFLAGALVVAIVFIPRVFASLVQNRLEENVSGQIRGSLDVLVAKLSWTEPAMIEDVSLLDPSGTPILIGDLELPPLLQLFDDQSDVTEMRWVLEDTRLRFDSEGRSNLHQALRPAPSAPLLVDERAPDAAPDPLDALRRIGLPGLEGRLQLIVDCASLECLGPGGESSAGFSDLRVTLASSPDDTPSHFELDVDGRQTSRPESSVAFHLGIDDVLAPRWGELEAGLFVQGVESSAIELVTGIRGLEEGLTDPVVDRLEITVDGSPAEGAAIQARLKTDGLGTLDAEGAWTEDEQGFRLELATERLPTRLLDMMAGTGSLMVDGLGTAVESELQLSGGARDELECRLEFRGEGGELQVSGAWDSRGIELGAAGLSARLAAREVVRERLLVPFLPWIELPAELERSDELSWTLGDGHLALSGDASLSSGRLSFEAPGLEYRYEQQLEDLVRGGQAGSLRRGIGPVRARIEQGRLHFEQTPLSFELEAGSVAGEVNIATGELDLEIGVPIAWLAQTMTADPQDAEAEAEDLEESEDLGNVTLSMQGTVRSPKLLVDLAALAELLGGGGEDDIMGRVQSFMNGLGSLLKR